MNLLSRMRKLNKILQRSGNDSINFEDICRIISEELDCNIYIVSRKGKILGFETALAFTPVDDYRSLLSERVFPESYNDILMTNLDTAINIPSTDDRVLNFEKGIDRNKKITAIFPIVGNRERIGSLLVNKFEEEFNEEDIILCESAATIVGLEILRSKKNEFEDESRKKAIVDLAINTLSFSELEAVEHIFKELEGNEGLLVASKIADKVGITRSVIVNALRKFESAGVIKSRSLGMKGTHITILNDKLLEELNKRF